MLFSVCLFLAQDAGGDVEEEATALNEPVVVTSVEQLGQLKNLRYRDVYLVNISAHAEQAPFESCSHSVVRVENSTINVLLPDDNTDCSVVIVNSRIGRVVSNKSVGLNLYARDSFLADYVSFYADRLEVNATNCTFGAQIVN